MKTKALIPAIYFLNEDEPVPTDKEYMTEDGLFLITASPRPQTRYDLFINDCGWRFVTEVSSLRCARVWIKNFYRTLTIVEPKSEIVPLLAKEQSAVNNIDSFLPKKGKFVLNYDAELEPDLVHHEGTIHYLWVSIAEFYLSNTYNY